MTYFIVECLLLGVVAALTGIFYDYILKSSSVCNLLNRWSESNGLKACISNHLNVYIYRSTAWIAIVILAFYWPSQLGRITDISEVTIGTLTAVSTSHFVIRLLIKLSKIVNYVFQRR